MIQNYQDFINALLEAGFSLGGGSNDAIFSIITWNWKEEPPYPTPVCWHTGDVETDPWEWRMRVVEERNDIAYGKFFNNKSGFITREWLPRFLAARNEGQSFHEAYAEGKFSHMSKRLYTLVEEQKRIAYHDMKTLMGVSKEETKEFERALLELQGQLYLTIKGRQQKHSADGEPYGWSSTVFATMEESFSDEVRKETKDWQKETAIQSITEQALKLNPLAEPKKIMKFILK